MRPVKCSVNLSQDPGTLRRLFAFPRTVTLQGTIEFRKVSHYSCANVSFSAAARLTKEGKKIITFHHRTMLPHRVTPTLVTPLPSLDYLFICASIHINNKKIKTFNVHISVVWTKWPTQGQATYVPP